MFTMRIVEVALSHRYVICLSSIHFLENEKLRDHKWLVFLKPLPLGGHSIKPHPLLEKDYFQALPLHIL